MRFRPATPDDLEAVLAVIARTDEEEEAEGDRERVTELLAGVGHFNEVAEVGGSPVGYVNLHDRGGTAHLAYLFVDPAHQRRGIGGRLMERALEHARHGGHERATLAVAVDNQQARAFYERAGWRDTGGRRRHRRLGLDMADYALDLRGP
jgi:ribosomal protein S18 acetylase RimI-like enzyme